MQQVDLLLLHENDFARGGCIFGHFFKTTPLELIEAGLFGPIAVAMHPVPHRDVSLTLAAQALGGAKWTRPWTRPCFTQWTRHRPRSEAPGGAKNVGRAKLATLRDWLGRQAGSRGSRAGSAPECSALGRVSATPPPRALPERMGEPSKESPREPAPAGRSEP